MALQLLVDNLNAYILVFCRIGGIWFLNPLLSRKNVPTQFRIALVLGITVLLTPTLDSSAALELNHMLPMLFAMIKELIIGVAFGYVFQLFYYLLFTVGDVADMGFGLTMARAFDPGTNLQVSVSGNVLQLVFVLYFFAVNGHLLLIKIMASSYGIVGMGAISIGPELGKYVVSVFLDSFSLAMRLALPFIAASFVLEIAMGVLMKLIPQINVFTIHFQIKIFFGLILLFLFAVPITEFIDSYTYKMFISLQKLLEIF
ncbi:MAG TPA: flagellar biosynthetic protein FliR [Clostridiales bacterium]|jgi:flagellar biosynthetic protein FliR|nr:flagellar biosynthetic protein FliR [Clostridiales bacterium]